MLKVTGIHLLQGVNDYIRYANPSCVLGVDEVQCWRHLVFQETEPISSCTTDTVDSRPGEAVNLLLLIIMK